jgi:phospho-N-acetylmuramoyl-pentapeptide-transferase
MILLIIDYLKNHFDFHIPSVFFYYSTRMMLAALTSLMITIFLGPFVIRKLTALKCGQSIRTDEAPLLGELHSKKKNTPTMGGVLILFSMLVSMFLWMDLTHVFTLALFITTLTLGTLGGVDDYLKIRYKNTKGLSARQKLFIQFSLSGFLVFYLFNSSFQEWIHLGKWFNPPVIKEQASAAILTFQEYASRIYLPFVKDPILIFSGAGLILSALFMIFVITGCSNAVNLTDGLDGLAAGCLIMVACALSFIAFLSNHIDLARYLNILYVEGSGEIAIYLSALVGACIGFLWYNGHPAEIIMGDTGSLALGGIIGVSAVLLKRELLLGLVGGIFLAEALSVILQVGSYKLRNKKRIFLCAPLHHHFEYMGWPETKVVIRFWIVGLLLAILGIASLKFQ